MATWEFWSTKSVLINWEADQGFTKNKDYSTWNLAKMQFRHIDILTNQLQNHGSIVIVVCAQFSCHSVIEKWLP